MPIAGAQRLGAEQQRQLLLHPPAAEVSPCDLAAGRAMRACAAAHARLLLERSSGWSGAARSTSASLQQQPFLATATWRARDRPNLLAACLPAPAHRRGTTTAVPRQRLGPTDLMRRAARTRASASSGAPRAPSRTGLSGAVRSRHNQATPAGLKMDDRGGRPVWVSDACGDRGCVDAGFALDAPLRGACSTADHRGADPAARRRRVRGRAQQPRQPVLAGHRAKGPAASTTARATCRRW